MKGQDLPSSDPIVRYVRPQLILDDGSAAGAAFELRPDRPDETGVSVHWLEAFAPDKENQLAEVRRRCRLERRPNGRFAEMNIGAVIRHVEQDLQGIRVLHDPLEACGESDEDPSYAQITGLPPGGSAEAELIGDLIAQRVTTLYPAVPDRNTP